MLETKNDNTKKGLTEKVNVTKGFSCQQMQKISKRASRILTTKKKAELYLRKKKEEIYWRKEKKEDLIANCLVYLRELQ